MGKFLDPPVARGKFLRNALATGVDNRLAVLFGEGALLSVRQDVQDGL
jgi:hypothetical protein